MKDLSRQEKIEQRIAELERQIFEKDYAFDKEQGKRWKRTFFTLCGVIYIAMFYFALDSAAIGSSINFETIENIFHVIVAATFGVGFAAGLIMFISYAVMSYITTGAMNRVETIAGLKSELSTLKSSIYNNYEDDKTKEVEYQLEELRILLAPIVKVEEKLKLEDLKTLLEPIVEDYHFIKVKKSLDNKT